VEKVRFLAAIALGKIGDTRAVGPLIAALQAPSDSERRFSAAALGKIGDPEAIEPLSAVLEDHAEIVRRTAEASLRQLGCDPQADAVERRKRKALSAAEGWWASKADTGEKLFVCDGCGGRVAEKRGTSLVGSYLRCANCTERLFSRWKTEGMD
jgi:hypothetical protein